MTDGSIDACPQDGQYPPLTPDQDRRVDYHVDNGFTTYQDERGAILGTYQSVPEDTVPTGTAPKHRRGPTGYVHDYTGRADEFRGGMKPAAPGNEAVYAEGISLAREAQTQARLLEHRNSTKTEGVLEALKQIGLAKSASGAVAIFAEDDITDPRRARLGHYRDGEHAQVLTEEYTAIAAVAIERACGSCALRFADCFMKDRPRSFIRQFETPDARDALRKDIKRTDKNNVDFNCSDSVLKEKR